MDLCRQSIYFDSIEGVASCFRLITADPDVLLVRVKNRFTGAAAAGGPMSSAGYRNLAVNLRVDNAEARALGAETHVCEVQLLLINIAAIKVGFTGIYQYLEISCGLL